MPEEAPQTNPHSPPQARWVSVQSAAWSTRRAQPARAELPTPDSEEPISGSSGLNLARLRTRFADHRRHQHTATARTPRAQTMSLKETLSTYWVHLQAALLPWLDEAPDGPLTPRHKQLVAVLGLIRIEALLPSWPVLAGRPPVERVALARAFVAKAVFNFPTTRLLITLLASDGVCQRSCPVPHQAASLILRSSVPRSGLRQTSPTGDQLRIWRDHRVGLAARASV